MGKRNRNRNRNRLAHNNYESKQSPETVGRGPQGPKTKIVNPEPKEQSGPSNYGIKLYRKKCSLTKAGDRFWFEMPDEDSDDEIYLGQLCKHYEPKQSPETVGRGPSTADKAVAFQGQTLKTSSHPAGVKVVKPQRSATGAGDLSPDTHSSRPTVDGDHRPLKSSQRKQKRRESKAGDSFGLELPYNPAKVEIHFGDVDWSIIKPPLKDPSVGNGESGISSENKKEKYTPVSRSSVQVPPVTKTVTVNPEPKEQSGSSNYGIKLHRKKCSLTKAGDRFWFEMPDEDSDDEIYFGQLCKH